MIQDKTQYAENGRPLFKDCDAVLDHLGLSLRASREVAEFINIITKEYQIPLVVQIRHPFRNRDDQQNLRVNTDDPNQRLTGRAG